MTRRSKLLLALALGVALAAGIALALGPRLRLGADPLANVPANASAILHLDVSSVLRSTLWERLVRDAGGDEGRERIRERCGFDPLEQVDELTVFITGTPRSLEHVTLLARGPFEHERLAECVREVVGERGGSVRRMEIEGVPAIAGGSGASRAAFLGRSGIVIGHEDAVHAVLRTVRGDAPSVREDAVLASLWDRLSRGRDVVAVGRLPEHWQRALGEGMPSAARFVRTAGISARVQRGLAVGALLRTGDASETEALRESVEAPIASLLDRPLVALSPAGPALRRIRVHARGRELNLALEYDEPQLARLLELVQQLQAQPDLLERALGGLP